MVAFPHRQLLSRVFLALSLFGVLLTVQADVAGAAPGSQSFSYTGANQTFTVPAGVTEVQVYLRGGGGGSNQYNYGTPGMGAYVGSVLAVTPGETLTIVVGGVGAQASTATVFGGGGAGGTTDWFSASGGGGTDIRLGGSALANRVVVAGGGGGNNGFSNGGNGGTPNGGNGAPNTTTWADAQGGRGATQSAGGAGGVAAGGNCYTPNGSAGTLGQGGRGGTYPGGSGGGGGYYGGGGGGSGCNSGAGGGGSSYADPTLTNTTRYSLATSVSAGCVEIAWPAGTAASTCTGTAPDITAPSLSSSSPADNATGVGLTANISLTFSENIVAVAGKNIYVKKSADDSTVETISATSAQVTVSGTTATINPAVNFEYSTSYYIVVDAGAFTDSATNNFAGFSSSTSLNFTTLADTVAPTLSSSTPADNATGVGIGSNISLTFSESVTAVSGKNVVLKKTADDSVIQTFSVTGSRVSVSGTSVTIDPTDDLDYSTSYYVTVDAGAFKDAANNAYAGISSSTALNFTTGADTTAPTLSSSTPADNATGVALTANISLVFSENVIAVSGKNITLKKSSDNSTVQTFSVTGSGVTVSGSTVTVNPSSSFSYLTGYYLLIDSGAFKDSSNNVYAGISSSTALNFTSVADTSNPTLVSTTPADNATGVATAANLIFEFSENIAAVSGKNVVIKKSSDNSTFESISVTNSVRVTVSGDTVTINPTNAFENSGSYYVLIDAGAFRDSAGNDFAGITSATALNFTVIGAIATTTTTTPISSSSNSSTTVATPTTAVAVAPSGEASATPTTVASVVARTATPSTSSTTSTTSTTVAGGSAEAAPEAPAAEPGTATAFINGVEVPMTITRVNNNLQISSANLRLEIGVYNESGEIVPLDADGNAVINEGSQIAYSVVGAQPGASLEAWLFSDPFKLGTVVVGEDGRAEGRLPVSVEVPSGNHRLVMKTLTGGGEEATVAIGVVSGASGSPATVGRIIFVSLLAAIAVGLIIPATRRRRRKQTVTA